MSEPLYIDKGAWFSADRVYRYLLWRRWDHGPMVMWTMLNGSDADEFRLDPTLRRVLDYTESLGAGGFCVTNVYGLVSTDPEGLWLVDDPVGPLNHAAIDAVIRGVGLSGFDPGRFAAPVSRVICGWGNPAKRHDVAPVLQIFDRHGLEPECLRTTKSGAPWHPLYLPASLRPRPWAHPTT